MTSLIRSSWAPFSREFHCRGCGGYVAFRSRPRGFFEKRVLAAFFLQPVRCDRCYLRSYVPTSVQARERPQLQREQPESQPSANSNVSRRVA